VLCEPPPSATLTLIAAACKGARLTWMLEKLTELGTTEIVIAEFERSVVHASAAHEKKLRRTALEAGKQSQRAWLPEVRCGATLADAVPGSPGGSLIVAHPSPDAPPLTSRLHGQVLPESCFTAVVGPEGGLTEAELALLLDRGGGLVRLAPHILRVETAAVAVAANWAAHLPA
jgi:16S rRNA (uracil1498-N3)-methyltransferase